MRVVTLLSRKPRGGQGFVLVNERNLADPFAPGQVIADTSIATPWSAWWRAEDPEEVQLLVKIADQ